MLLNQALAQALLGVLIICALSLGAASISTCLRLIYETWRPNGKPPEDGTLETEQVKAYSAKYADRVSKMWLIGPENNVGLVSVRYELNNDWTLVATETGLPGGYLDITISTSWRRSQKINNKHLKGTLTHTQNQIMPKMPQIIARHRSKQ